MTSATNFDNKATSRAPQMLLGTILCAPPDKSTFLVNVDPDLHERIMKVATALGKFLKDEGIINKCTISVNGGAIRTLLMQNHVRDIDHTVVDIDVKIRKKISATKSELLDSILGREFRYGRQLEINDMKFSVLDCATLEAMGGMKFARFRATFPDGKEIDVDLSDTSRETLIDFDINVMRLDFNSKHPKGKFMLNVAAVAAMKATVMNMPQECHIIRTVFYESNPKIERINLAFTRVVKMLLKGYKIHGISEFSDEEGDCCPICITSASDTMDPTLEADPAAKIYGQLQRHAIHLKCDHKICIWCFMKNCIKRVRRQNNIIRSCPSCRATEFGGLAIYSPLVPPSAEETLTPDIEEMLGINLLYADFSSPPVVSDTVKACSSPVEPSLFSLIQRAMVLHDDPGTSSASSGGFTSIPSFATNASPMRGPVEAHRDLNHRAVVSHDDSETSSTDADTDTDTDTGTGGLTEVPMPTRSPYITGIPSIDAIGYPTRETVEAYRNLNQRGNEMVDIGPINSVSRSHWFSSVHDTAASYYS